MEMKVYKGYFASCLKMRGYLESKIAILLQPKSDQPYGMLIVKLHIDENYFLLTVRVWNLYHPFLFLGFQAKACFALFIIDMKMLLWWPFHNFYGRYLK